MVASREESNQAPFAVYKLAVVWLLLPYYISETLRFVKSVKYKK